MSPEAQHPPQPQQVDPALLPRATLAALLSSAASSAALWWLAGALGVPLRVALPGGPEPLPLSAVIAASAAASLLTAVTLLLLARTRSPFSRLRVLVYLALLLSLRGPLSLPPDQRPAQVFLCLMRLAIAVACLRAMTTIPRRRPGPEAG